MAVDAEHALSFELAFGPPFDWPALLGFLADRAVAGVEAVIDGSYRRTVSIDHEGGKALGWVEARLAPHARPALVVRLSSSLASVVPQVLARIERLFDLGCDPQEIASRLGSLAAAHPGLRVPGAFDGFETAVRAVLGQQVTVKAARTLAGRFAARFGTTVPSPFPELRVAFPTAARISRSRPADIGQLGIVRGRVRAIQALARALDSGELVLEPAVDLDAALDGLRALPGFGEWTVQYIAMRALAWPDAFPHTDLGVKRALGEDDARKVLARAEAWRPWRAYAVMHLWSSLA
jgi:AraC family transcriptional regulator of adaptative response / DNA-3-methyladenine glycosylase II